jgi:Spy/CpxP family protein refolding chaperone
VRRLIVAVALAMVVPSVAMAQAGPRGAPPTPEQRAELEGRVIQRFIQQTGAELGLAAEQTVQLETLFREQMTARRQVARSASELRRRLQQAVQTGTTSEAQFARMLSELETLRNREHELEVREQARLAELLTPKQRAILAVNWFRMQENMREVMSRRDGSSPRHH